MYIYLLLFLLMSCGSGLVGLKETDSSNDLLREESLIHFDQKRIEVLGASTEFDSALADCFSGKISNGLKKLEDIFEANRLNANYWNVTGLCHLNNSNLEQAYFYLNLGLTHAKNNSSKSKIKNNMAIIMLELGYYQEAFNALNEALELAPSLKTLKFNLAHIYLTFGQPKKAIELLSELRKINSRDNFINAIYAKSLLFDENYKQSVQIFSILPIEHQKEWNNAILYSFALFQVGQKPQALEILNSRNKTGLMQEKNMSKQIIEYFNQNSRG